MSPRGAEVDELWSAVADPTRRRLLDVLLVHGDGTATTLAGELPVTRQAVAKHLAVLDRAGLVEGGRRGREVRYAVRPEQLDAATRRMVRVAARWDERLAAIKRIAESSTRERPSPKKTQQQRDRRQCDDGPQGRNPGGMAGRARRAAQGGEGAHAAQR